MDRAGLNSTLLRPQLLLVSQPTATIELLVHHLIYRPVSLHLFSLSLPQLTDEPAIFACRIALSHSICKHFISSPKQRQAPHEWGLKLLQQGRLLRVTSTALMPRPARPVHGIVVCTDCALSIVVSRLPVSNPRHARQLRAPSYFPETIHCNRHDGYRRKETSFPQGYDTPTPPSRVLRRERTRRDISHAELTLTRLHGGHAPGSQGADRET